MQDVHIKIEEYNPRKKHKVLIVFGDMIAYMHNNKKLNSIVVGLFIRGRKLNISLAFIIQSTRRCYTKHYGFFIIKIQNKREFEKIAYSHSSDIDFKVFMNLYKKCIAKPYSFLVIDVTLESDNPLRFRKIF